MTHLSKKTYLGYHTIGDAYSLYQKATRRGETDLALYAAHAFADPFPNTLGKRILYVLVEDCPYIDAIFFFLFLFSTRERSESEGSEGWGAY